MLLQLPNASTNTSWDKKYENNNETSERFYDTSHLTIIDAKTPSHTRVFASTDTTPVIENEHIADTIFSMSTQVSAPVSGSLFPISHSASTTFHDDIFGQLQLPADLVLPASSVATPVAPHQTVAASYAAQSAHFLQPGATSAPPMQELIYQPENFYATPYNYSPAQPIPQPPSQQPSQPQSYFLHPQQQQQHHHQPAPPPPPLHFPGQGFPTFDHDMLAPHSAAAVSAIPIGFGTTSLYGGGAVPPGSYISTSAAAAAVAIEDRGVRRVRGTENRCSVCSVTETPSWRRHKITSAMVCNACGLYYNLHGRDREFVINSRGQKVVKRQPRGVSKKRRQEQARMRNEANRLRNNQMPQAGTEAGADAQSLAHHPTQGNDDTIFNVYNGF